MQTQPSTTSSSLPAELKAELRQRLEAERAALLARHPVDADDESIALTATTGQGETELATRDIELALATTRARADAESIASIDAALARLDDSTYGICTSCGTAIPTERLVALPDATRCVSCQQRANDDR
jgi:DnaK suppressor protein